MVSLEKRGSDLDRRAERTAGSPGRAAFARAGVGKRESLLRFMAPPRKRGSDQDHRPERRSGARDLSL